MNYRLIGVLLGAIVLVFLVAPAPILAIDLPLPKEFGTQPGQINLPTQFQSIQNALGTVFNLVFAIAGVIFIILLVVGGVMYLTAAGNEENTTKARRLMIDAIVGLIITLSAFAIGKYVLTSLTGKITSSPSPSSSSSSSQPRLPTPAPAVDIDKLKPQARASGKSDGQRYRQDYGGSPDCSQSALGGQAFGYYNADYSSDPKIQEQYKAGFFEGCLGT